MKTLRVLALLVFVSGQSYNSSAQSYAFMVLSSKGLTEIKAGNSWNAIKVGELLKPSDEIKVPSNGYLGLSHVSGKPLEIREAGNYKVIDLASKIGKGSSPLNKYTDFILSSNQEKKNKLAATGAVHRGEIKTVQILLPDAGKADLLGDNFSLNWTSDGSEKYTVIILDLAEEELSRHEVVGTSHAISFSEGKLNEQQILVKVVSAAGNSSDKVVVKRLTGSRLKRMKDSIDEFNLLSSESTALEKYILANIYEEKLLLIDALTAYKEAAEMEPEVELYRTAYDHFLERLGFKGD